MIRALALVLLLAAAGCAPLTGIYDDGWKKGYDQGVQDADEGYSKAWRDGYMEGVRDCTK